MADSWIKMRGGLVTNPKVIKMARVLLQDADFLSWYANDGVTLDASLSVTRRHVTVVTRVTVGALTPLWATVNECVSDDGVLRDATLFEVDEMAGVPGFGRAMEAVGWLFQLPDGEGLEFPNFIEHNTVGKERSTSAKSNAERAREYRERKKKEGDSRHDSVTFGVTGNSDASRDAVTTEKRREEKNKEEPKGSVGKTDPMPTCPTQDVIDLYHELLPELPAVRLLNDKRRKSIGQLWRWVLTSKKADGNRRAETAEQALAWLRDYFGRARENDFLMGRGQRSGEHANWQCDIDFLISDRGMKHVIEKTRASA